MKKKNTKIPNFKSYQEEARFWDTHSFADFQSAFKRVTPGIKKPLKITFSLRLDPDMIQKLDNVAKEKGIGPATLARMWLIEKLKTEITLSKYPQ